jgi:predicted  nucleic acid-binding Zn-ribbon protein
VSAELARIAPERQMFQAKAAEAQTALDAAKNQVKQLETERKGLELEVQSKKQLIERYANQQLQTRKNEEYRALTHEIDGCKAEIFKIENREIELMEQGEAAQHQVTEATQAVNAARRRMEEQLGQLAGRESNLRKELSDLEANRGELAAAVGESERARYERLAKSKGENVVVGVPRGVCGGCHMGLPPQVVVSCQAQQELVVCPNCGRILYYTRDMDMTRDEFVGE